jgi:MFS family permease
MMFGTNTAILTSSFPAEKRGQAMGFLTATVYFSLAAGPFFGGVLTQYFDWHSVFIVSAIIGSVVAVGGFCFINEDWREEVKSKFDIVGSILFATGLSALIYGFTALPYIFGFIFIAIGLIVLCVFAFYEKQHQFPVFNIREFITNRVFCFSSLSALINYSATFAISFMLSLYLQNVRGLSPSDAGLFLILQSLIQAVISLISGNLSDKISAYFLATAGMTIIAVGLAGLCFISEDTNYWYLGVLLVLMGLGFGIFSSPNTNIIMGSVEKRFYGMASATMGTMRLTGQSLSMGIAVMSISLIVGNMEMSSIPHDKFIISSRITFALYFALCLFGIYASSRRKTSSKNKY